MAVYLKGSIWYAACSACPSKQGQDNRMRSVHLPYTHGMALRHVAKHRAEVR